MQVSIVIVNYNTTDHLAGCLNSIIRLTRNTDYEIIVVDNNSPNRDIEKLAAKYDTVRFFLRNVNDGFGSGCNYAAGKAEGKYLFFVNPDVVFKSDVVSVFLEYLEGKLDVCMCSGLLEDASGSLLYSFDNFPDIFSELRETFYVGYEKHIRSLLLKREIENCEPFEVDYAFGALLFLRKSDFEAVGGFDERFFLFSEDIDLAKRLKKVGKIVCIPSAKVFHFVSSSIKQQDSGKYIHTYHLNRSRLIYIYKYYGFFKRNFTRALMILAVVLRIVYIPFNRSHKGRRIEAFIRIARGASVFFSKFDVRKMKKIVYD